MKKMSIFSLALLIAITACHTGNGSNNSRGATESVSQLEDNQMDINVQYIRTDKYAGGVNYPAFTIISTVSELELYSENYKEPRVYSGSDVGFAEAIKKYSNEYFENNYVVMVLLEENSGSIRHRVERIEKNGDIVITRLIPNLGTSDMAEWHIIIGLKNSFMPKQFKIVFKEENYG